MALSAEQLYDSVVVADACLFPEPTPVMVDITPPLSAMSLVSGNAVDALTCHGCEEVMARRMLPVPFSYGGHAVTIDQPGWYCVCGMVVMSSEDCEVTDGQLASFGDQVDGKLSAEDVGKGADELVHLLGGATRLLADVREGVRDGEAAESDAKALRTRIAACCVARQVDAKTAPTSVFIGNTLYALSRVWAGAALDDRGIYPLLTNPDLQFAADISGCLPWPAIFGVGKTTARNVMSTFGDMLRLADEGNIAPSINDISPQCGRSTIIGHARILRLFNIICVERDKVQGQKCRYRVVAPSGWHIGASIA